MAVLTETKRPSCELEAVNFTPMPSPSLSIDKGNLHILYKVKLIKIY